MSRKITFHPGATMKTAAPASPHVPGSTPEELRRRMSDLYADYFSNIGQEAYKEALDAVAGGVEAVLKKKVDQLKNVVKEELGRKGYDAAIKHVRPWLESIVRDLRTEGFSSDEWSNKLNSLATEFSVETPEQPEAKPGDELMGVEKPEQAPAPEAAPEVAKEEVEELSEEDVAALLNTEATTPAAPAPPAPAPAEQPKAAAQTVGDLRRQFAERRQQRQVTADTLMKLRQEAENQLKILER